MKTIYDPPSDPYGHEKRCKICDTVMEFDKYNREFYCEKCEEEGKDDKSYEDEQFDAVFD